MQALHCPQIPNAVIETPCSLLMPCVALKFGSFTETELGEVKFPEITTPILEKTIQYFYYKLRYQNSGAADSIRAVDGCKLP
eukprot:scaffold82275_cov22-Tisochrysis_lutea.AAC.2